MFRGLPASWSNQRTAVAVACVDVHDVQLMLPNLDARTSGEGTFPPMTSVAPCPLKMICAGLTANVVVKSLVSSRGRPPEAGAASAASNASAADASPATTGEPPPNGAQHTRRLLAVHMPIDGSRQRERTNGLAAEQSVPLLEEEHSGAAIGGHFGQAAPKRLGHRGGTVVDAAPRRSELWPNAQRERRAPRSKAFVPSFNAPHVRPFRRRLCDRHPYPQLADRPHQRCRSAQ